MASRTSSFAVFIISALLALPQVTAQSLRTVRTTATAQRAFSDSKPTPISGAAKAEVSVRAQIQSVPSHAEGSLTLRVTSEMEDGTRLFIDIPLSSTDDAYGESRSCNVSKEGKSTFTFTAGLDEKNFVEFAPMKDEREFRFLLNKYLCRALAAAFQCVDPVGRRSTQRLRADMDSWSLGTQARVILEAKNYARHASATAGVSAIKLIPSGSTFDYTQCAVIAPSNGVCCVGGKTTQWHCGGTPAGEGWHQVSGDCFHRETGSTCKD